MKSSWSFQFLGRFRATWHHDGVLVEAQLSNYAKKLIAVLVLRKGTRITKAEIGEQIWPLATESQSRSRLNVAVHDLRAATFLASGSLLPLVDVERSTIGLSPLANVFSDLEWLLEAESDLTSLNFDELAAATILTEFRFFHGESGCAWIDRINESLDSTGVRFHLERVGRFLNASQPIEALRIAAPAFAQAPANEPLCRVLMQTLVQLGRRDSAIQAFDKLRRELSDTYDMKVSDEMQKFATAIRQNNSTTTQIVSPIEIALRVDGDEPIPIRKSLLDPMAQTPILFASEPASQAAEITASKLSWVVMSARSLNFLVAQFSRPSVALIWLWGAPGSGKSWAAQTAFKQAALAVPMKSVSTSCRGIGNTRELVERVFILVDTHTNKNSCHLTVFIEDDHTVDIDWGFASSEFSTFMGNVHIVVTSENPPPPVKLQPIRVTNLEALAPPSFDSGLTLAAEYFLQLAEVAGHQTLMEHSSLLQIEEICRFVGGNPALIEEAVGYLQHSSMSGIKACIITRIRQPELTANSHLFRRIRDQILRSVKAPLNDAEIEVIKLLQIVSAPISIFRLADLRRTSTSEIQNIVESLCARGLLETIRSNQFDLIFVAMSGVTAEFVSELGLTTSDSNNLNSLVANLAEADLPLKHTHVKIYRRTQEQYRFELPWFEKAIRVAVATGQKTAALKLSRLLRQSYFDYGNLEAAAKTYAYAIQTSENEKETAEFYAVMGGLLERAGITLSARWHLLSGLGFAKRNNDYLRIATLRHSLGIVLISLGRYVWGEALLRSALNTFEELGVYDRCQRIAASLSLAYTNALELEKSEAILLRYTPDDPAARTAGVQSWHLCSSYLAMFKGQTDRIKQQLEFSVFVGANIDHAQLAYKLILLRASVSIENGKHDEAINMLNSGTRLMIMRAFNSDAIHGLALEALAKIALNEYFQAQITVARAISLSRSVDHLEATALLSYAGALLENCSSYQFDQTFLKNKFLVNLERFPRYVLAAFAKQETLVYRYLPKERADELIAKFKDLEPPKFLVRSQVTG